MTASVEMISSWRYLRYAAMNPLSHKTLHCSVIFPKTVPVKMPWRVGIIGAASGTNEGPTNGQEGTSHGGWLNMTVLSCKKSFHLCRELLQFGKVRSPLSLTFGLKKTAGIITANFTICDANVASLHMFFFSTSSQFTSWITVSKHLIDQDHQSILHCVAPCFTLQPPTLHWLLVV